MSCKNCTNWVDATADCAAQLKCIANNEDVPTTVKQALDRDAADPNDCDMYC